MNIDDMNVLVVASAYPNLTRNYSGNFYHTRNKYYLSRGIDVTVLSFQAEQPYVIDGIKVITRKEYEEKIADWKLVVCHAPDNNIYKFLTNHYRNFKHIIFVFHGNEVLRRSLYYKWQYPYVEKDTFVTKLKQDIRDRLKLFLWKNKLQKLSYKSDYVFVSNWMYEEFLRNTKINPTIIKGKTHIIYNCIGDEFEEFSNDFQAEKSYDFITIRGSFDSNKYAIDVVNEVAKQNPKYKFLLIGNGKYFEYNQKASNIEVISRVLSHEEIITYLKKSRCGLMPTRHDAQGVMMCEMVTFGLPMVTSDIKVCREVLNDFPNIFYIDNEAVQLDADKLFTSIVNKVEKNTKYFKQHTCEQEVKLIVQRIMSL